MELSSHPGKGIVDMDEFIGTNCGVHFAGIGPKEGSACMIREGKNLCSITNGVPFRCYNQIVNGYPVVWDDSDKQAKQNGEWLIRDDDKIAPVQAPHLCLGTSPQCLLHLVSRDSPNRLTFQNHAELKESQNQVFSKDRKGIPLILSSHQNCCILYRNIDPVVIDIQFIKVAVLFIGGPLESSVLARFSKNNELVLDGHGGFVLRAMYNILKEGNIVTATRDNCDQPRPGQPYQVNDDGSISPIEAPHLVLGFPELKRITSGQSNEIQANTIKSTT